MPRKNYDKMYKSEEPTVTEVTPDEVVQEELKEVVKRKRKEDKEILEEVKKTGKVIGGASLNVRFAPEGKVETTIAEGVEVTIEEDLGDWYKISYPATGYVMKKFIEV